MLQAHLEALKYSRLYERRPRDARPPLLGKTGLHMLASILCTKYAAAASTAASEEQRYGMSAKGEYHTKPLGVDMFDCGA